MNYLLVFFLTRLPAWATETSANMPSTGVLMEWRNIPIIMAAYRNETPSKEKYAFFLPSPYTPINEATLDGLPYFTGPTIGYQTPAARYLRPTVFLTIYI